MDRLRVMMIRDNCLILLLCFIDHNLILIFRFLTINYNNVPVWCLRFIFNVTWIIDNIVIDYIPVSPTISQFLLFVSKNLISNLTELNFKLFPCFDSHRCFPFKRCHP